jgi:uncharacterized OsmC-like protein
MSTPGENPKESMTLSWMGGVQFRVEVRNHHLVVDQPVEEDGQDQGVTPVEMFVASLGTCMGYFAARFFQRHKIHTDGFKISMEWDYAEQPHRVGDITAHLSFPVKLEPTMKARLQKVLEGCTVHQSLIHPPKVTVTL